MSRYRPYYDTFEIYVNGSKMRTAYGIKSSIKLAQAMAGDLFGLRLVEVVNVNTGEIVYTEGGGIMKK